MFIKNAINNASLRRWNHYCIIYHALTTSKWIHITFCLIQSMIIFSCINMQIMQLANEFLQLWFTRNDSNQEYNIVRPSFLHHLKTRGSETITRIANRWPYVLSRINSNKHERPQRIITQDIYNSILFRFGK